jgi:hypothetical protein
MRGDVRFAVAARQDGLRRVRRLTFRIGAAGVACSAVIALAFSHLSGSAAASSQASRAGSATRQGGGSLQAPAQNVAPAQGPAQGVSGGS